MFKHNLQGQYLPPKSFYMKQLRYHTKKAGKLKCSIWFISECLSFGLIPHGLQLKYPVTGLPPVLLNGVKVLANKANIDLTIFVLNSYYNLFGQHNSTLNQIYYEVTSLFQNTEYEINTIFYHVNKFMSKKYDTLNRKLSVLRRESEEIYHNFSYQSYPPHNITQFTTQNYVSMYPAYTQNVTNSLHNEVSPINTSEESKYNNLCHGPVESSHTHHNNPLNETSLSQRETRPNEASSLNINTTPCQELEDNTQHRCNNEYFTKIENLSSYIPNQYETSVLEKGLTFSPTPKFNHIRLVTDVLNFARSIRIKHHFKQIQADLNTSLDSKVPDCLQKFNKSPGWEPPPLLNSHPIEQFINLILANISDQNFLTSLPERQNLSKNEFKAIKSLKNNKEIVLLPADKGNSIVILNTSDYINEADRQLSDTSTYKLVENDPTQQHNNRIKNFLLNHGPDEGLSTKAVNILSPKFPRTPIFYLLPKIHKDVRPPPGRPIVSSYNCPTERISSYVDDLLQPFVKDLPSYIRDTNHFLNKINEIQQPLPSDTILVTIDVESLYTNIPHQEGLNACKHFLEKRPSNTKPSTKFVLNLITMILTLNNFKFQNENYLQIKGTAMGTRMAPSFANLFMGLLEQNFLSSQTNTPLYWFRFIDDIFVIWDRGLETLQTFLDNLYNFSILNFTWKISSQIMTFLDVDVFLDDGYLKTKIHIKNTNKMQYLHYTSCHPMHIKRSIPKSLSLRAKKLCSSQADFDKYISKLSSALISRGYPEKLIDKQTKSTKNSNNNNYNDDPKFVTQYYPGLHKINKIIKTAYPILENSLETRNLFSKPPKTIFSKPPNLQNIISRPKLNNYPNKQQPPKCNPCSKARCGTCKILVDSKTFSSSTTNKKYPIKGNIDCNTSNVIYQLSCKLCPKDYIGKTITPLRIRMNNHRFDITHQNSNRPVSKHAIDHNKNNFEDCFSLKGIYQLQENLDSDINNIKLRNLEIAHQLVLKSRQPDGLNIR